MARRIDLLQAIFIQSLRAARSPVSDISDVHPPESPLNSCVAAAACAGATSVFRRQPLQHLAVCQALSSVRPQATRLSRKDMTSTGSRSV